MREILSSLAENRSSSLPWIFLPSSCARARYEDLRRAGYEDDEFPAWWYSPARDEASSTQKSQVTEVKTQQTEVDERLEEVPPKNSIPIEGAPTRLPLSPGLATPGVASPDLGPAGEAGASGFTSKEIDLLGSQDIVRGQDGIWVHIVKEPSGRTIIARER